MKPDQNINEFLVFGGEKKQNTLQSYQLNHAKKVYLVSTMHHDLRLYYNKTKTDVDITDEMCKVFQNILDVTAIKTFSIFNQRHLEWNSSPENKRRRGFFQELSTPLAKHSR